MATILVVDDSAYARRRLRQVLEARDHTVLEAGNGMEALESYVVNSPALVLLDLTMEGVSGLDVLSRMREIDPDARVVVVSADVQRTTGRAVAEAGALGFLAKPADPDDVIAAVNAALGEVAP